MDAGAAGRVHAARPALRGCGAAGLRHADPGRPARHGRGTRRTPSPRALRTRSPATAEAPPPRTGGTATDGPRRATARRPGGTRTPGPPEPGDTTASPSSGPPRPSVRSSTDLTSGTARARCDDGEPEPCPTWTVLPREDGRPPAGTPYGAPCPHGRGADTAVPDVPGSAGRDATAQTPAPSADSISFGSPQTISRAPARDRATDSAVAAASGPPLSTTTATGRAPARSATAASA